MADDGFKTNIVALASFADYLEELGDPRAAGYRALWKSRLYPWDHFPGKVSWWNQWRGPLSKKMFGDFFVEDPDSHVGELPEDLYKLLEGGILPSDTNDENVCWGYNSIPEALDAFAVAFSKLPAERQRELLGE